MLTGAVSARFMLGIMALWFVSISPLLIEESGLEIPGSLGLLKLA